MTASYDCIVCGSCVVDLLIRPVALNAPIGVGALHRTDPIIIAAGGITCNSGITLARLGLRAGVLSYVGQDAWAAVVRDMLHREGVDDTLLLTHSTGATSTTIVAIDPSGERSFFHCVGAPKLLNAQAILGQLQHISRSRFFLIGYYSLMPNLEPDLPSVLESIRRTGCRTAMDAAGSGGAMQPLDRFLPHLDVYVPSRREAEHQTGETDPRRMIDRFRACGAPGVLGIKLGGTNGALLSERAGEYVQIESCAAPGPIVDTTGAGDSFYAGLLAGLIRGLSLHDAGRIGCATGACCVTALGGSTGGRSYEETARLAGVPPVAPEPAAFPRTLDLDHPVG